MLKREDIIMFACMCMLTDTTEMSEEEVYDLLSQEQIDRLNSMQQFADENKDNDEKDEESKNQLIEILKTL